MTNINEIPTNKGKIVEVNKTPLALFNNGGKLMAFSTTCTHQGCDIEWNDSENTWDCPCHGSRYESTGNVINGPAELPLNPIAIKIADDGTIQI